MSDSGASTAKGPPTSDQVYVPKRKGTFNSNPTCGKRKVSAHLLTPSDSGSYDSLSSSSSGSSSASLRLKDFTGSFTAEDVELPEEQDSVATLKAMGFEEAIAQDIYERWETRPDSYPYDFVDHAAGQFDGRSQGTLTDAEFMTKVGPKQEFQLAILDPQHAGIFKTETLKFWILDTLRSRHNSAAHMDRRCTLRVGGGKGHKKKKMSRPSLPAEFERGQSGPSDEPVGEPTESMSVSTIPQELGFPKDSVRIGPPAAALEDHDILYKGRRASDQEDTPLIAPDGSIDLTGIETLPGGDFNARGLATYWTPERETAEVYRGYAQRRDRMAETWIISIQVPRSFTATLRKKSLWYSADWKEYVWHCRRRKILPSKFDSLSKADVIQGHICRKLQPLIAKSKPNDVQTTINEDFCLLYQRAPNQMAKSTQWAFSNDRARAELQKAVRGKLHIDVYPSSVLLKDTN